MGTTTTTDPTAGCGQGAVQEAVPSDCGQATAVSACGQGAVTGCGQETATSCGQEAAGQATASDCGQDGPRLLDAPEMRAWRAFLSASTIVTSQLNHELEVELGLSMHEYEILVRLSEAPERTLRMSVLADGVAHSRSRLTHTVRRLENDGYVERFSCASDGRGVNCRLTDAGLAFLGQAAPVHLAGVRRHVIDRLAPEQLATLADLLEVLAAPEAQSSCGQAAAA